MTTSKMQFACALALGAALSFAGTTLQAQTYPDRPIHLIAPFPAGGLADVLARAVADGISKTLGQPVIVENRAGAGGNVGADVVAKSAPDGYTLLMTSAGILYGQSISLRQNAVRCRERLRAGIERRRHADDGRGQSESGSKNSRRLVALARANPGKLNFGSPGIGTTGHLGLALFMHAAGIKLTHIPYKGAAPAITDLIGGQIDGTVDNPPTVLPHIAAGRLRALAVAAKKRMPLLPDLPTAAEAGVTGFEASSWFGVVAPAGTPPAIVVRLHKEIVEVLRQPDAQARFAKTGARLLGNTPEEFAQQIRQDRKMWGEVIRSAGIKAE